MQLPSELYTVKHVVELEQRAIKQHGIAAYELMKRAGTAVFNVLDSLYPHCRHVFVLCGAGNNGGDGYVVARLARQAGYRVTVTSLVDHQKLKHEARLACDDWLEIGDIKPADISLLKGQDIVIDTLLGTGLARELDEVWSGWIEAVNLSRLPVISVDVPSGLYSDTGALSNAGAIRAEITLSFIGLKQGLFTAQGRDVSGEILYDNLGLSDEILASVSCDAHLLQDMDYALLPERPASSHKGKFGHVLIAGGNEGMPGAVILAATAALRTGAGKVTIVTIADHLQAISKAVPEAMIKVCDSALPADSSVKQVFEQVFIDGISHVAVGMGLGRDDWAREVLTACIGLAKPMLVDADALTLLAENDYTINSPIVITPHPGEAARLLSKAAYEKAVQDDRFEAIRQLYERFAEGDGCTVVLKGSGTLIYDGVAMHVCSMGSAAMSSAGMGDVLSGMIISLMAQQTGAGSDFSEAVKAGVCLHAKIADMKAGNRTRGLIASDLVAGLPEVLL